MPSRSSISIATIVATVLALVLCVGSPALAGPRDARLKYQQGQELFAQKRYPEAVRAYQRALAAGGDRVILFDLGRAQQAAGMNEEAIASYESFLRAAPMSPLRFQVRASVKQIRARLRATSGEVSSTVAANPAATPAPVAVVTPAPPPPPSVPPPAPAAPAATTPLVTPPVAAAAPAATPSATPSSPATPAPPGGGGLKTAAMTLVIGGALLTGGGIGCLAGAAIRSDEVERAVRFDPEVDASGRRFQTAGSVLTIVGVASLLVGGELFRRHAAREADQAKASRADDDAVLDPLVPPLPSAAPLAAGDR